ncbi:hypothetical protein E4U43_000365 [Claviceps pusilla]|uniref:Uncharacterized protein n=1 Tax=Claviceps pusilla TaxID=123648 RepID=A0A9P7SXR0_9HYPO|nr:hypothetical protein E4U43_000365 [Claviceps pusilla]
MFAALVTEQDVSESVPLRKRQTRKQDCILRQNGGTTSKAVTDELRAAVEPKGKCQATVSRFKKRNAETDALGKRITRNCETFHDNRPIAAIPHGNSYRDLAVWPGIVLQSLQDTLLKNFQVIIDGSTAFQYRAARAARRQRLPLVAHESQEADVHNKKGCDTGHPIPQGSLCGE